MRLCVHAHVYVQLMIVYKPAVRHVIISLDARSAINCFHGNRPHGYYRGPDWKCRTGKWGTR